MFSLLLFTHYNQNVKVEMCSQSVKDAGTHLMGLGEQLFLVFLTQSNNIQHACFGSGLGGFVKLDCKASTVRAPQHVAQEHLANLRLV